MAIGVVPDWANTAYGATLDDFIRKGYERDDVLEWLYKRGLLFATVISADMAVAYDSRLGFGTHQVDSDYGYSDRDGYGCGDGDVGGGYGYSAFADRGEGCTVASAGGVSYGNGKGYGRTNGAGPASGDGSGFSRDDVSGDAYGGHGFSGAHPSFSLLDRLLSVAIAFPDV